MLDLNFIVLTMTPTLLLNSNTNPDPPPLAVDNHVHLQCHHNGYGKPILFDDDLFNYNFASLCWSSIPLFWCMPWSPFFKHENTCIRFYPRCGLRCRHWLYQSLLWMLIYILTRESSFHTRYKAKTILC